METKTTLTITLEEQDEIIHQSDRTLVFRRAFKSGKTLVFKQSIGSNSIKRLRHEKRILSRLSGINGVIQLSPDITPSNAIAMADTHSVSLAEVVQKKLLKLPVVLELSLQLARILTDIHRAGVIHKDINTSNILLCGAERKPLLTDFDLASTFAEERPDFVQPKEIAGTLAYLAPEQTGRTGRVVDQRSDLYALGALLYELSVGHPPFQEKDPLQMLHNILAQTPIAPKELNNAIPRMLSKIITKLLKKEPDKRYQSAAGVAFDLAKFISLLNNSNDTGPDISFTLAEHDFPIRLNPPSTLIGRDEEISTLRVAFNQALKTGESVLISGLQGVGKTALTNELRSIAASRRGWFVTRKYDPYLQDLESDPLIGSTQDLIRLLLTISEADLKNYQQRLSKALGNNACLLAALFGKEFKRLVDVEPETISGNTLQTESRIKQAWLDMIKAIVSPQRPLVLVIDDLQCANEIQINFIKTTLIDYKIPGLLFVGCYRTTETTHTLPSASLFTDNLLKSKHQEATPLSIHLANLSETNLAELLTKMMRLSPEKAEGLTKIIFKHTDGNPLDTVELINAMRHGQVLILGESSWEWDDKTLEKYVGSENIADLLKARIERMPDKTRELLECIACLGPAHYPMLATGCELPVSEIETRLMPALEDGILVMSGANLESGQKVFLQHETIRQTVYEQIREKHQIHLNLARRLISQPEFKTMATEQFLAAVDIIDDPDESIQVIELLLSDAIHHRKLTNYVNAKKFLLAANNLLNKQKANISTSLQFSLKKELHLVLYCLGELKEADKVFGKFEQYNLEPQSLIEPTCTQINSLINRGLVSEGFQLGKNLLQKLGLEFPDDLTLNVAETIEILPQWMQSASRQEDFTRPESIDPNTIAIAQLLSSLQLAAFILDHKIWVYLLQQSIRFWEQYGPSNDLMGNLLAMPVMQIFLCQDYGASYLSAKHLLDVCKARKYEHSLHIAQYGLCSSAQHWFEPVENCIHEARRAHEGLLHVGDMQLASLTYNISISALFDSAMSLNAVESEIESAFTFASHTGNENATLALLPNKQLIKALQGDSQNSGSFDDEEFNEPKFLESSKNYLLAIVLFHIKRAICAAIFDDQPALAQHTERAMPLLNSVPGYYVAAIAYALRALSLTNSLRTSTSEELVKEFDTCRNFLAQRAANAPSNYQHLLNWIDAEHAWTQGEFSTAYSCFDVALFHLSTLPRPWHRALISERAGLCYIANGQEYFGRLLLSEALHNFETWGANGKVTQMWKRFPFLRNIPNQRRTTDKQGTIIGSISGNSVTKESIDLLGIFRASQALSSETTLPGLRNHMKEIMSELTGATHLYGFLWDQDSLQWLSPYHSPDGMFSPIKHLPADKIPYSVLNYIERTRQPLIVEDVARDERFKQDPYFANIDQCSLMGVPIFNQDKLRHVSVYENRLSSNSFTHDQLETINLLVGQFVISTDNALLYASLEQKVAERTEELKKVNDRLSLLSITDPLTELANRRRFDETIATEWRRGLRTNSPLGLVIIDIDEFKLYNDHYGHQEGDACLKMVAEILKSSVRDDTDLVARYGGEEFVYVLPGADVQIALEVAERARSGIAALQRTHEKSRLGIVTISAGVASLTPCEKDSTHKLISKADSALYGAKNNGKNRVEIK